jgi:hypothetical protein
MTAKAIGFLRKDLATDPLRDATTNRELAERVGHTLIEICTPGDEVEPEPATWLLARIHRHRAAAVVIADQRHMAQPVIDAITAVCSVVTPVQNIPRHVQYPEGRAMEYEYSPALDAVRAAFEADDAAKLAIARTEGPLWMAVDKPQTWVLVDEDGTPGEEFSVGPTFGASEPHEGDAE